jgi:aminopeptidase N
MLETLLAGMRKSVEPFYDQGPIALGYRLGHIKSDSRVFRAIVYNKSSVVLHMLRRLVGDEAFFRGVKRFYDTWRFKKAGTDDFQAAIAAETPINLERFFERWIYGFGRPRLHITWHNPDAETSIVRVEQAGEVFDLPLTVVIQFADGRSETRTLKITDQVHEERLTGKSPIRRVTPRDELSIFQTGR